MYRHVRKDHNNSASTTHTDTALHHCPVSQCNKIYKIEGWLKRHIRECHPQIANEDGNTGSEQNIRSTNGIQNGNVTLEITMNKCPYPGCTKQLLTWRGIVNHCYRVHSYSAIARRPVIPEPKQTAIAPR